MELGFEITRVDGWTILGVTGEVDVATAPSMREQLIALIAGGDSRLIVDLSPVDFLDSTGLGVLVGALKPLSSMAPSARLRAISSMARMAYSATDAASP